MGKTAADRLRNLGMLPEIEDNTEEPEMSIQSALYEIPGPTEVIRNPTHDMMTKVRQTEKGRKYERKQGVPSMPAKH